MRSSKTGTLLRTLLEGRRKETRCAQENTGWGMDGGAGYPRGCRDGKSLGAYEEMRFDHTVGTVAMPGDVWAVWTDVARWPEWDTELESAFVEGGGLVLGASGTLRPERGPTSSFVVSEFEPERGYAFTTRLPLCDLVVRRRRYRVHARGLVPRAALFPLQRPLGSALPRPARGHGERPPDSRKSLSSTGIFPRAGEEYERGCAR